MGSRRSVPDGETLPPMLGCLELVDERDGIVLHRDAALVLLVGDQFVRSQTELARALPGQEVGGRSQVGPVDRRSSEYVQRLEMCLGDRRIRLGQMPRIDQRYAGGYVQAARSADNEEPRAARELDRVALTLGD